MTIATTTTTTTMTTTRRALGRAEPGRLVRPAGLGGLPARRGDPAWSILTGDCRGWLYRFFAQGLRFACVFVDPPYNFGLDYGPDQDDRRAPREFRDWLIHRLAWAGEVLAPGGSLWVLLPDEHVAEVKAALTDARSRAFTPLHLVRWVKWYESFGVQTTRNFSRRARHLIWLSNDPKTRLADPRRPEVRCPSARQTVYRDARACPDGMVLPDCWTDVPRLAGTHKERRPWARTQLPRKLLARVIEASTHPGDLVLDPMCGSGTAIVEAVCRGRRAVGIELDPGRAALARLRCLDEAPFPAARENAP